MLEFCVAFTKDDAYPFYIDAIGVSRCTSGYSITRHNSPYYCFEYIINGTGYVQKDELPVFTAAKNDLFILPENHKHYFYTSSENPWFKIWFTCSGDFVSNTLKAYKLENTNLVQDINLLKNFFKIYNICKNSNIKTEAFNRCANIFLEIIQNIYLHTPKSITTDTSLAAKVKKIIDDTENNNISLASISKMLYCSIPYIIDSFKSEYNMTPHQYIIQKKIQLAKSYLANTKVQFTRDYTG